MELRCKHKPLWGRRIFVGVKGDVITVDAAGAPQAVRDDLGTKLLACGTDWEAVGAVQRVSPPLPSPAEKPEALAAPADPPASDPDLDSTSPWDREILELVGSDSEPEAEPVKKVTKKRALRRRTSKEK